MKENYLLKIFTEQNSTDLEFLKILENKDYAVIFLTISGEGKIVQKLDSISLSKNSIVFFEEKDVQEVMAVTEDFQLKVLAYKKSFLADVNIKLNKLKVFKYFSKYFRELAHFSEEEMDLLLKQILTIQNLQNFTENIGFDEKVFEHLFSAFIYTITGIYLHKEFFDEHKMSRADEITFQFTKNVFFNCLKEKSPRFYADLQNMTSRHLTTMVKSITGKTASQVIAEFVMNEAKLLLQTTDRSIMQIADDLNFGDSYTFSHYFKRYEGQSPAYYRSKEF